MFEFFYEWMKNIAFFTVLMTAVTHILPETDYRKYVRFYMGLLLVILLAAPVFRLFGSKNELEQLYQGSVYQKQMQEIEDSASFLEEIEAEDYLEPLMEDMENEDSEVYQSGN